MSKKRKNEKHAEVSLLGFGCMRFPTTKDGHINEPEAEAMLEEAYDRGVNYFDTAYPYHDKESEPFVGAFLERYPRKSYFLATKLPCWEIETLDDAKKMFDLQLERLNKSYVDFFMLHALDAGRWEKMDRLGVPEYLQSQKDKGKIRALGFSFHDQYEVFERIIHARDWDFCQIQLNFMDTDFQAGLKGYQLAAEKNIPVIVMEPIKGGSLARMPDDMMAVLSEVRPDATPSEWAIRWAAQFPNVKVILSGMSTMEQVVENCNTCSTIEDFTKEECEAIENVAELFRKRLKNNCTGCRYCVPCPTGVDIPRIFELWNDYAMFQNLDHTKWHWHNVVPQEHKAMHCIECGKCIEACPQGITIIEDLKSAQKELDDVTR